MDCCNESSYNQYDGLQNFTLLIIQHLMLNNEDIWKLLKYDTQDALEKPNLTREEKAGTFRHEGGDTARDQLDVYIKGVKQYSR